MVLKSYVSLKICFFSEVEGTSSLLLYGCIREIEVHLFTPALGFAGADAATRQRQTFGTKPNIWTRAPARISNLMQMLYH